MADPPPDPDGTAVRKGALRAELRARRRAFVADLGARREVHERALATRLLPRLSGARVVAFTRAVGSEFDPVHALAAAADAGFVTALPVLPADGAAMHFRRWTPGDLLRPGPHGIHEPASGAWIEPDLIVLPLVGFDRRGGRLGQGGGWYDRTLEGRRGIAIGLAWSCQEVDVVPSEPHDVPMQAVLTEREWIQVQ